MKAFLNRRRNCLPISYLIYDAHQQVCAGSTPTISPPPPPCIKCCLSQTNLFTAHSMSLLSKTRDELFRSCGVGARNSHHSLAELGPVDGGMDGVVSWWSNTSMLITATAQHAIYSLNVHLEFSIIVTFSDISSLIRD